MAYLAGIDVSVYQPTTPPLAGLSFAFARSSYGVSVDSSYAMHAANIRAAGLVLGAYHYFESAYTAAAQVATFLGAAAGVELLAIDLEGADNTAAGRAEVVDMIARLHSAGRRVGLYHSLSGYPNLGQDWRWVAYWSTTPPPIPFDFWQYRGAPLDLDRYNGTAAELAALAGGTMNSPSGSDVAIYAPGTTVAVKAGAAIRNAPDASSSANVRRFAVAAGETWAPPWAGVGVINGAPGQWWFRLYAGEWEYVATGDVVSTTPPGVSGDLTAATAAGFAAAKQKAITAVEGI